MKEVTNELKKLLMSFVYAIRGLGYGLASERNLRVHLVAVLVVVLFGMMARLSLSHWCLVVLCCMVVFSLELMNTALERLCDKVSAKEHPLVRRAKDAAAAAVLVAAVGAVIVAVLLLKENAVYRAGIAAVFASGIRTKIGLIIDAVAALIFIFIPSSGKGKKHA